jgi:6,7-dimethyl-8-ribityllumazine synthase
VLNGGEIPIYINRNMASLQHPYQKPVDLPNIAGARVAILQSRWHHAHTDRMIAKCRQLLAEAGCQQVTQHVLPGSLELVLAAQDLAGAQPKPDAIICFGIIQRGETAHYDMLLNMCAQGLTEVMLRHRIPILNEIIGVADLQQVIARSQDDGFNKGWEAAQAAIDMIAWRRLNGGG